jgi:hypothetical protein
VRTSKTFLTSTPYNSQPAAILREFPVYRSITACFLFLWLNQYLRAKATFKVENADNLRNDYLVQDYGKIQLSGYPLRLLFLDSGSRSLRSLARNDGSEASTAI